MDHYSRRAARLVAATVLVAGAAGCHRTPPTPVKGHAEPPTIEQLGNLRFRTDGWGDAIQLRKGEYETADLRISLTNQAAFGDIDGDGSDDAAVVLVLSGGGSGIWRQLALVLNRGGQLLNVDTVDLGDRVGVDWMRIVGGRVLLDMVDHGPDDPLCCPTLKVRRTYALTNGKLVLVSTAPLEKEAANGTPVAPAAPRPPATPLAGRSAAPAPSARAAIDAAPQASDTGARADEPLAPPPPPDPLPAPPPAASAPVVVANHAADTVEVVDAGPNPVIRFPVGHQHFATGCYGYLYFSRDAIWYVEESPAKDKGHSFRQRRADLKVARQWKMMGTQLPELELKFRNGTYHFIHVTRGTVDAHPDKPGWDIVRSYEDLLRAATSFDDAVRAASEIRAPASVAAATTPVVSGCEETTAETEIKADGALLSSLQADANALAAGRSISNERLVDDVREAASALRGAAADVDDLVANGTSEQQRALHAARERLNDALRAVRISGVASPDLADRLSEYRSALAGVIDGSSAEGSSDLAGRAALLSAQAQRADGVVDMLVGALQLRAGDPRGLSSELFHAQRQFVRADRIVRSAGPSAARSDCTVRKEPHI